MTNNIFDSAAWFLLSYSNTLSFGEWRTTAKQAYLDLEAKYGAGSAKDNLAKMVAYYCMEVAPGSIGRKAQSHFRKVHQWADFRDSDQWWLDEWKARRAFDLEVNKIRTECLKIPSVLPDDIEQDYISRTALDVIVAEMMKRYPYEKQRYSEQNFDTMQTCARVTISTFGGTPIIEMHENGELRDRTAIPSLQSMYFLERSMIEKFGTSVIGAKKREYLDAADGEQEPQDSDRAMQEAVS